LGRWERLRQLRNSVSTAKVFSGAVNVRSWHIDLAPLIVPHSGNPALCLYQRKTLLTRLTGFSRLLAKHASRLGLTDHKWSITTSGGREKPAFGGPNPSIWCVAALVRYTVSRCALRLPECLDLTPSNGSIMSSVGISPGES